MRIRRDVRGPGPHLEWRVRLMGAGAIVALIGIWAEAAWLVNVAIVLLFVGFLLRFAGGRTPELEPDTEDDEPEDDEYEDDRGPGPA